ncbi:MULTISPECIES: MFS transporter [unclassified Sphingomonas]|jgi:Na+/melibiose symporter-like transporter|uniref:MFS transporter n=1 Tax=unclassified Sphingomonas TaxID=196159 RepID=UPI000E1001D4|nr:MULTISPECIES: MFS transporter [unclassified Sphingomonas]AXJ94158.1 hypothetical protein DM480_00265 [Sphingomonas sp. FARSPH]
MAAFASDPPPVGPHPLAVQVGYSVANLGKSVVWSSFESIMLYYLVSIAGFGPLAAGCLLATALLWDAAFDLVVARWTDRSDVTNRLAQSIVIGAPLCGIGFWLVFALSDPTAVAAAIIACRVGYSLCDVGHNTLLIRVARAPGDAARVSGLRLLFSAAGVALLALASGPGLRQTASAAQQSSFAGGAMIGGLLYIATLFAALYATRGVSPPPAPGRDAMRRARPMRDYWRDPVFRRLLCVIALQAGLIPLFQRALPFFGRAVHADAGWAAPALLTLTMAQSLALPGWMALARLYPPRTIATLAYALGGVAMTGLTITTADAPGFVLMALHGAALGGMSLAIWALLTDAVQRSLAAGGEGEASAVGLFLAVLKTAAALGNLAFAGIVAAGPVRLATTAVGDIALLPACATVLPLLGCLAAGGLLWRGGNAASLSR